MFGLKRKPESDAKWQRPFDLLREKWVEIPTSRIGRAKSSSLLDLPDDELIAEWEAIRRENTTGPNFGLRGWYHTLYADSFRGKRILDVGSGLGVSPITFAQNGAEVTCLDLAESNLNLLKRICRILDLSHVRFHLLRSLESLRELPRDYDFIMAIGSLHHAPQSVIRPECAELVQHLKFGGRWLQLAYSRSRWENDRKPDFDKWGEITDGPGTPWSEWYDVPKLLDLLVPASFEVVFYREFCGGEFNWFDLLRR